MKSLFLLVCLLSAAPKAAEPDLLAEEMQKEVQKAEEGNLDNSIHSALAEAARTHARLRRLITDGAEELRRAPLKSEEAEDAQLAAELLERKAQIYVQRAATVSEKLAAQEWKNAVGLRAKANRESDLKRADAVLSKAKARWGEKSAAAGETALLGELDSCLSELREAAALVPKLKARLEAVSGERELLARQLALARYLPE
jgi:hypothetical protein